MTQTLNTLLLPIMIFNKNFEEINIIAVGGYGVVSKVSHNTDHKYYAIKRIAFSDKNKTKVFNEIEIMESLKSEFVIHVKEFWTENNYLQNSDKTKFREFCDIDSHELFKPNNKFLLHIQLELCFKTLKQILLQIKKELNEKNLEIKSLLSFYISSEMFNEILECVHFLHSRLPLPIIHRDLKPSNILITYGMNGRFVKLGDFGISKQIETLSQSNTACVGTELYMAPEVKFGTKYSIKADDYSIGCIIPQIFNFDINDCETENIKNTEMRKRYEKLIEIHNKMTLTAVKSRMDCKQVLSQRNQWSVNIEEIERDKEFKELIKLFNNSIDNNFCSYFVLKKLENNKK